MAQQLKSYLQSFDLLPSLQSGFRPGHSTETAVLRVMSDLLEAVNSGDVAALVLLDLSAAFDTVDHSILCRRLQVTFGLDGPVLAWFHSYLHSWSQCIRLGIISRPLCNSCAGSHRAQFSAQSYSSCTLLILLRWLSNMVSVLICTWMILRYMAQPDHRLYMIFSSVCRHA